MGIMMARVKIYLIILTIGVFISTSFCPQTQADDDIDKPGTFNTMIDATIYRPFGLAMTIGGFGIFVISLPFSALGGNVSSSFDSLVKDPARFTFKRPLGDIE